jgi:polyphosphate kinase
LSKVPLNTDYVSKIRDALREHSDLFFPKHTPAWPAEVTKGESIIPQVEDHDMLFSYPYESIKPFLRMLWEAAEDDSVISIKMTLYRLAKNSQVVDALIDAVENGKEVVVLVELKARFDEENNIRYARKLEEAGCQVIYGIDKVKVHSKLCLVTRKGKKGLKYISQIGTGNYNEKTAELYTDLTMMTANKEIGKEVSELFREIGMGEMAVPKEHLLVAPNGLQNRLLALMDEQIHLAMQGEDAYIAAKLNSLTDKKLMKKMAEASKAGVKIDLIVRGICCLKPGIKGETDNITIISIVGRYLEHSRIYMFGVNCDKIYIGSADWMTRNTRKRIEVATPILDENLKKRICSMFTLMLNDKVKARKMESNGKYSRVSKNDTSMASQDFFCMNPDGLI